MGIGSRVEQQKWKTSCPPLTSQSHIDPGVAGADACTGGHTSQALCAGSSIPTARLIRPKLKVKANFLLR